MAHRTNTDRTSLKAQHVIQQTGNLNHGFQGCDAVQSLEGCQCFEEGTIHPNLENGGNSLFRNVSNHYSQYHVHFRADYVSGSFTLHLTRLTNCQQRMPTNSPVA